MSAALICDQCAVRVLKDDPQADAWLRAARVGQYSWSAAGRDESDDPGEDPLQETRHFCSTQCAGRWFVSGIREADAAVGANVLQGGSVRVVEPVLVVGEGP